MIKSESIKELAVALSKVQGSLEGAKKDAVNPFFKQRYADLSSVWDACRDLLASNGLAVVQTMSLDDDYSIVVDTTLIHSSGEWISGQLGLKAVKEDPQGAGSAITYARRYALAAIVGIAPEDDDAEAATTRKPTTTTKQPTQKAATEPNKTFIDLNWLKQSMEKLEKAGNKAYSRGSMASYLKSAYEVEGASIVQQVNKLTASQANQLKAEINSSLNGLK